MITNLATLSAAFAALAQALPSTQSAAAADSIVTVDLTKKYQEFDGMGVSEAFQRSKYLHGSMGLSAVNVTKTLDLLFSNTTGAGFTILRNGLGSSPNATLDHMESIEPVSPESSTSDAPHYIALPMDDQYQVWLSKQAIARGVQTIYADAWSADGYMKTTGTDYNGGYLCGVTNATCATGDWRQAYADKIVKYLKDYQSRGIDIAHVGFLNEPDLDTPYASMQSDGQQAADFLEILYPTLQASGLKTQIACCDGSGWEQNRERLTGIQEAGLEYTLGIVTSHGYSSAPTTPFNTTKHVWQTEWSTFDATNYEWYSSSSQSEGLTWANHIQSGFAVSNMNAFLYWWGAAETTDNQGLISIHGDTVTVSKRLWAFAQYSRFVHPGAYRVDAVVSGMGGLAVSAFENSDGSVAVQVINNGDVAQTVRIKGVKAAKKGAALWLTDNYNDLTETSMAKEEIALDIVRGNVPARSLVSFVVPA